jgi:4-aminobutyrate aminotransferase-like enzyme
MRKTGLVLAVAALFMEGVTGSNGIIVPPDDYWPRLREITKKSTSFDLRRVMSGFGRTGAWFAVDHARKFGLMAVEMANDDSPPLNVMVR